MEIAMKTPTPKPPAPEPMEVCTGNAIYINLGEIRWKLYNLAFKLLGNTRYWGKIGFILW
jgi:hypothetical protein